MYGNYRDVVLSEPSRHSASIDMRQPHTQPSSLEVGVPDVKNCFKSFKQMANEKMSGEISAAW